MTALQERDDFISSARVDLPLPDAPHIPTIIIQYSLPILFYVAVIDILPFVIRSSRPHTASAAGLCVTMSTVELSESFNLASKRFSVSASKAEVASSSSSTGAFALRLPLGKSEHMLAYLGIEPMRKLVNKLIRAGDVCRPHELLVSYIFPQEGDILPYSARKQQIALRHVGKQAPR